MTGNQVMNHMNSMMNVRRFALALMVLCMCAASSAAQQAGAFARLGFGPRGMAMGNGLSADVSGAASPYYNPALAPLSRPTNITTSFALLSHDRSLQYLQFAAPLDDRAGFAVGFIHAGVSEIDGRDASGYHTRTYSTNEYAFFTAFGIRLGDRVTAGLGLRLYRSSLVTAVDPANGLGLSAGVTARITDRLHLALAADDLLASYSWDTGRLYGTQGRRSTDEFPLRIRLGAGYGLMDGAARLLVEYESRVLYVDRTTRSVEVVGGRAVQTRSTESVTRHEGSLRVGGEWEMVEPFTVRAGVSRLEPWRSDGIVPSAGFSLRHDIEGVVGRLDYAAVIEPYLMGMRHVLGLRVEL